MRNRILSVAALALAFILGWLASSGPVRLHAQTQDLSALRPQSSTSVPSEWGSLRGVSDNYLVFEDRLGTIRMVFIKSGLRNFIEVKRQWPAERE